MICFVALFVFGILAIFSAKYRAFFWEAADCVFRKATLRKCNTSFDKKMRMKISAKITGVNKPVGSFVFKHFEGLSWILTAIMIVSIIYTGYSAYTGLYNWTNYGNCNGPNSDQVCVYNAISGQAGSCGSSTCTGGASCTESAPELCDSNCCNSADCSK
ncbi:MAG: hypothetical protein NTZ73_00610 [Candidatus Diapherotrites archaeon]|nr:hypothetical protein [Candidatus Diapherotrites archaeon]